ncbi:hypothetical protein [Marimonas lutisalis]|uniref:hypothetical protein n=1 Tax=Marimonas lutisalis TaxID=2545756 RepID=UPI0010F850EB|nr:hypothetical protein [Marimonas lutisalis]
MTALAPLARADAACDAPVCLVSRDSLALSHLIDFEDIPNSMGIGTAIDALLARPGARFGERFAGQALLVEGDYDRVEGLARPPLTALPGAPGQSLGAMRLPGTVVLHGLGQRGFPRDAAAGEGMIAIEFEHDHGALAFDLRGGEQGHATVIFLRRDGSEIARLSIGPLAEESYGFLRNAAQPDIAGILILNSDPQGIAIDNLAFDDPRLTG